jgi:hypothetical protein
MSKGQRSTEPSGGALHFSQIPFYKKTEWPVRNESSTASGCVMPPPAACTRSPLLPSWLAPNPANSVSTQIPLHQFEAPSASDLAALLPALSTRPQVGTGRPRRTSRPRRARCACPWRARRQRPTGHAGAGSARTCPPWPPGLRALTARPRCLHRTPDRALNRRSVPAAGRDRGGAGGRESGGWARRG